MRLVSWEVDIAYFIFIFILNLEPFLKTVGSVEEQNINRVFFCL